jgi:hypothetical protein
MGAALSHHLRAFAQALLKKLAEATLFVLYGPRVDGSLTLTSLAYAVNFTVHCARRGVCLNLDLNRMTSMR